MLGFGNKNQKANAVPQAATPGPGAIPPGGFEAGAAHPLPHAGKENVPAQKTSTKAAPSQSYSALKSGSVSVVDLISPSSVEVDFKNIRVGDRFFRTFFVVDYPRQVSPNWLSILIDYKETMNISMFVYPVESKDVFGNLRRKIS